MKWHQERHKLETFAGALRWLRTVAIRKCVDVYRREVRRKKRESKNALPPDAASSSSDRHRELQETLAQALLKLPERQREAVALVSGNAGVTASEIDIAGGSSASGNAALHGVVNKGYAVISDPLANLAAPAQPSTQYSAGSYSGTLQPGTYVGGITVSGNNTVTLESGTYYLTNGGLTVSGNAKVTGTGAIYLDSTAEGYGWFTSTSPASTPPTDEIDLLTVVSHELGHLFGLMDGNGTALMASTLAPGVRILPAAADLLAPHAALAVTPDGSPTQVDALLKGGLRPIGLPEFLLETVDNDIVSDWLLGAIPVGESRKQTVYQNGLIVESISTSLAHKDAVMLTGAAALLSSCHSPDVIPR